MKDLERRAFWPGWGGLKQRWQEKESAPPSRATDWSWMRGPWVVDREIKSRLLATPLVIMTALSSAGIATRIDDRLGRVDVWFGHSVAFTFAAVVAFGIYEAWGRER